MKSFPMFLRTTGRRVVIAGGGEQAAQKLRLMLKTDAAIRLAAPEINTELRAAVATGRASHLSGPETPATFEGAALCFIATGCVGADAALHALAREAGALVNVVDRPELCDAITPSIVDRDPVVVAIGTEGTAPVLGRALKTEIETLLPPRLGLWAAHAGGLRAAVARRVARPARHAFWAWMFKGEPGALHRAGHEADAASLVEAALERGRAPAESPGRIALVGAGPGARDLMTLRAVERLQEADLILYDRLVDAEALELARRDAERICVGKAVGSCAWPQERINALMVAEARVGRSVVRLKSGDPSIFGRSRDELDAARAAGIPVEIVPGVTAASAAVAEMGESLTERGRTDTVVLVTGTCRPGDPPPDWAHHMRPGTVLAIYMGVGAAGRISRELMLAGAGGAMPVEVAADVSTARARHVRFTLADLPQSLRAHRITGVATILLRVPKGRNAARLIAAE